MADGGSESAVRGGAGGREASGSGRTAAEWRATEQHPQVTFLHPCCTHVSNHLCLPPRCRHEHDLVVVEAVRMEVWEVVEQEWAVMWMWMVALCHNLN